MPTLTVFHVAISLIAIAAGFIVLAGLIRGQRLDTWTAIFLVTTIATSVTGYGIPAARLLPSHIVGAISLVVLAIALVARYLRRLEGGWRRTYVVTAMTALYLNVFVLVVQLFIRVPFLQPLAPTQSEPPFQLAQAAVLVAFLVLGRASLRGFQPSHA
jgi:hypothetical protein